MRGDFAVERRTFTIVGSIFMLVGIIMLVVAFFIYKDSTRFYKTAEKTEATIEYIDKYREYNSTSKKNKTRHDVYISYYTSEGEYYDNVRISYYSSSMKEGKSITVYYDPDDPSDVRVKAGSNFAIWILLGMGGIFTLIGVGLAIKGIL